MIRPIMETETFVLRASLTTGLKVIAASLLFIGLGISVVIFVPNTVIRVVGLGLILLGLLIVYKFFTKNNIVLIANNAGIIPVYLVGKQMTLVPWSNIKRFDTATKEVPNLLGGKWIFGNVTLKFLTVYFNQPQELAKGVQAAFLESDAKNFQSRISDGGTADLYVPTFNQPIGEVIDKLEDMRRKSENRTS